MSGGPLHRAGPAALLVATGLLLTGCAATVSLQPAPHATSVGCARVVVGLPQTVGQADRRNTDAQGTGAWGTPSAVTLRCGVETPAISALPCVTVEGVDWLLDESGDRRELTTYGRTPGVQVVTTRDVSANDAMQALSGAVEAGTRGTTRQCLAEPGASATPGSTVAPTPSATP